MARLVYRYNVRLLMVSERFIPDVLQQVGERMFKDQTKAIEQNVNVRTGELLSGRRFFTTSRSLTLLHPDYERFLDMKKHSGRRHKQVKIHNRFVYGAYATIAYRLMHGITENVMEDFQEWDR